MKPNLAYTVEDPNTLAYPLLASAKLDGIRCVLRDGLPYSRNMKLIPNQTIQDVFGVMGLGGLDGELIVGDPKAADCFNRTTSGVMSRDGDPGGGKWAFYVFDWWGEMEASAAYRMLRYKALCRQFPKVLKVVEKKLVKTPAELLAFETQMLLAGFEGVMVQGADSHYKEGRSTQRENGLGKLKRFADSEAVIIGFVEQQQNNNEQTRDELGRAKRSTAKAGKTGKGTLGALQVRDIHNAVEFEIGTGFDDALRADIWGRQRDWYGKVVKYKSQPVGAKDKPRFPVYLGLRDAADI